MTTYIRQRFRNYLGFALFVTVPAAVVIDHFRQEKPEFPEFLVGSSIAQYRVDDGSVPLMEIPWIAVRKSMPPHGEPRFTEANSAQLEDNVRIAAINIDGDARAYVLSNMDRPDTHVLIHSISTMASPVCITYCNVFNCIRAFEANASDDLDSIRVAGRTDKSMLLRVRGHVYSQDTGEARIADVPSFPLAPIPAIITTWGEWFRDNPDGLVFLGDYLPAPEMDETVAPSAAG